MALILTTAIGCLPAVPPVEGSDASESGQDPSTTGAAEGQECVPWYEPGDAPPGLENVGVCAVPE